MLKTIFFLLFSFPCHALIECPPGAYEVKFVSPVTKKTKVFCQKTQGDSFVKVGKEYEIDKNGQLVIPGTKTKYQGEENKKKKKQEPENELPPLSEKTLELIRESFSASFDGTCQGVQMRGELNGKILKDDTIEGGFHSPDSQVPLSGNFTGKFTPLKHLAHIESEDIMKCIWEGTVGKKGADALIAGKWHCRVGEEREICYGLWRTKKLFPGENAPKTPVPMLLDKKEVKKVRKTVETEKM